MGAAVGTGDDKRNVNVELNIVPFIDLMSCLTAFLLITAAWVKIAQLDLKPKGKSRDQSSIKDDEEKITLSVLVGKETIWLVKSRVGEQQEIKREGSPAEYWGAFRTTLTDLRANDIYLRDRTDLELATESLDGDLKVPYQDVIYAMDHAKQAGWTQIGYTDRDSLTTKPTR